MCVQTLGLGVQGAAAGLQAGAAYRAVTAQNMALDFNSDMMMRNVQLTELQAEDAKKRGAENIAALKRGIRRTIGTQRAAAAGAGVRVEGGSVGMARASAELAGDIGAEKLRRNAAREAWYLQMQALMYASQARMMRASKGNAGLAFATSLIGSVSQMANSYYGSVQEASYMGGQSQTIPVSTSGLTGIAPYTRTGLSASNWESVG